MNAWDGNERRRVRSGHRQAVPHCGIPGSCMGDLLSRGAARDSMYHRGGITRAGPSKELGMIMQALIALTYRRLLLYRYTHLIAIVPGTQKGALLVWRQRNGGWRRLAVGVVRIKPFRRRNYCRSWRIAIDMPRWKSALGPEFKEGGG
jgi:hypothetical protein